MVPEICLETPLQYPLFTRNELLDHVSWDAGWDQRREVSLKLAAVVAVAFAVTALNNAMAQTKSEKCAAYVRAAARQTPAQIFRAA